MSEPMGPAEFTAFKSTLRAVNTIVDGIDEETLVRFVAAAQHADSIGPFVDPTAWMRGHENLAAIAESARALLAHKRTLRRLAEGGR